MGRTDPPGRPSASSPLSGRAWQLLCRAPPGHRCHGEARGEDGAVAAAGHAPWRRGLSAGGGGGGGQGGGGGGARTHLGNPASQPPSRPQQPVLPAVVAVAAPPFPFPSRAPSARCPCPTCAVDVDRRRPPPKSPRPAQPLSGASLPHAPHHHQVTAAAGTPPEAAANRPLCTVHWKKSEKKYTGPVWWMDPSHVRRSRSEERWTSQWRRHGRPPVVITDSRPPPPKHRCHHRTPAPPGPAAEQQPSNAYWRREEDETRRRRRTRSPSPFRCRPRPHGDDTDDPRRRPARSHRCDSRSMTHKRRRCTT